MADVHAPIKSESSEDDSVSLTSTIVSDGDGVEYDVDCILAEWETDGVMWYLTKWEGYPEEQSTWQLRDTFNPEEVGGHDVFKEWQEKKMRICRGYEKPYDIDDFERRRDKLEQEVAVRRARRREKKARLDRILGRMPSDSDSDSDSEDTDDSTEGLKGKVKGSDSSSSSSSGNEAHPIVGETPGSIHTKTPWTDAEKQIFLKGLQDAKSPEWNQILAWYGQNGSISQALKDKTLDDLRSQLQALRQEFAEAGREPPDYMNAMRPGPEAKQSTELNPGSKHRSKVSSTNRRDSSDGQNSSNSVMEDNRATTNARHKTNASTSTSLKKGTAGLKRLAGNPKRSGQTESVAGEALELTAPRPEQPLNAAKDGSVADSTRSKPTNQSPSRPIVRKKPYSGTARTSLEKLKGSVGKSNRGRTGSLSIGPTPLSALQSRKKVDRPTPKTRSGGIDVTANWRGELKKRKARILPTINAVPSTEEPLKVFKSLRARNNVQKWRRNEPAPDPSQLVFLDPKTGKAPIRSLPSSIVNENTAPSSESPFRSYQKELAEKEATNRSNENSKTEVNDNDSSLVVDNDELGGMENTDGIDTSAANSYRRRSAAVNSNTNLQSSLYKSINPNPLVNAPSGPRAQSTSSLNPNHQLSSSNVASPVTMVGNGGLVRQQTLVPSESTTLVLRGQPRQQEKEELYCKFESVLVLGNIRIGPRCDDIGKMKLAGFSREVKRTLLTIRNRADPEHLYFDFDSICPAADYAKFWHNDVAIYSGSGHVIPYRGKQKQYDSIAEFLAVHTSAGLFFTREFTMVLWPAGSGIWEFIEKDLPPVPAGAVLRFAVREPILFPQGNQMDLSVAARLRSENMTCCNEITTTINDNPIRPEETNINLVFRDVFGIEFNRLLPSNGPRGQPAGKNFFLCFVPAGCETYEPDEARRQALRLKASEEHDLFVQFLQANGADSVYSMQNIGSSEAVQSGSWRYFIDNVESGAVIIHQRCGRPDQLPYFARFLSSREGGIKVWLTSLSSMEREGESHPHLVRYFPHGGVVLLTISLMLYHPHEALRILRWFRLEQVPSKYSGTWKVAVRPRIRKWLLDLHDLCCEKTRKAPFGDFTLQVYADIYTEISLLLQRDKEPFGLLVELWDSEVPLPEAPVVAEIQLPRGREEWTGSSYETAEIDHNAVRWNDEELIQWFSEWASTRLHDHRKFHVVLGYSKGDKEGDYVTKCYEKGYGYLDDGPGGPGRQARGLHKRPDGTQIRSAWERNFLEFLSYDRFFHRHKIPDESILDKKEADRRKKENAALNRLQAEAEAEWKEERITARKGLESVMKIWRDKSATEEQARAAGRQHLMWRRDEQGTASYEEVADCAIDMNWKPFNRYACMVARTKEEQEAALKDLKKEEKRLADKERLSGTREREDMWSREIQKWALRDRVNRELGRAKLKHK